jgi:hypothetical protein
MCGNWSLVTMKVQQTWSASLGKLNFPSMILLTPRRCTGYYIILNVCLFDHLLVDLILPSLLTCWVNLPASLAVFPSKCHNLCCIGCLVTTLAYDPSYGSDAIRRFTTVCLSSSVESQYWLILVCALLLVWLMVAMRCRERRQRD